MPKVIGNKSALELALAELTPTGLRSDEFTAMDFVEEAKKAGKHISLRSARETLSRMSASGKLNKPRRVVIDGRVTNAYSAP